ncbi:unnamed protein product [Penicillium palitans]
MPTKVFILVYIGDPLDYTKFRHTALHMEFPEQSRRLVSKIPVAELQDWITEVSLKGVVQEPQKNGEMYWNCQNWVGDALARMVSSGYLTAAQRASAIDLMTDACLEAQDE